MNSWKLAVDSFLARSYINDRVHADFQVRWKIHNDVTNAGLERGVTELAIHRHELCSNAACAGFCAHTVCYSKAMNTAAAGLRFDWPTATTSEANAAATGFHVHGSGYAADLDISTTSGPTQISANVLHRDISATGLNHCIPLRVLQINVAATGRCLQHTSHGLDIHLATTGSDYQIGTDVADVDGAAASAGVHTPVNVVEIYGATAGLSVYTAVQVRKLQAAAIGLSFYQLHRPRSIDVEFDHAASPVSRTFSAEIGDVALPIGEDAEVLEVATSAVFRVPG